MSTHSTHLRTPFVLGWRGGILEVVHSPAESHPRRPSLPPEEPEPASRPAPPEVPAHDVARELFRAGLGIL